MASPIGMGTYAAYIAGRGGSPVKHELGWSTVQFERILNATGGYSVSVPSSSEVYRMVDEIEPWVDEVIIYRDSSTDPVMVGPLVNVTVGSDQASFRGFDLFHWMEVRFLPDLHADGDAGDVFRAIFEAAYEMDISPNINLTARHSGIRTSMDFQETEFHRAADALRELSKYSVDFTMVGRRLLAGRREAFLDDTPLILHDDAVVSAETVKEGENLATDAAIFGATLKQGTPPISGRQQSREDYFGLIQRSYTELLIKEGDSAEQAALARLKSMQPSPRRVKVNIGDRAGFEFDDLMPGRRFDVRLSRDIVGMTVGQDMRLQRMDVDGRVSDKGKTEDVSLSLIPIGVTE